MPRVLFILRVIIALAMPAAVFAQGLPAAQFAGGYSYLTNPNAVINDTGDETDDPSRSGVFAEVIGNMTEHVGVVGQFTATFTTGTLQARNWRGTHHAYSFLGGGRATSRCCRGLTPFGQALAGLIRMNTEVRDGRGQIVSHSNIDFALALGGGADVRIGEGPVGVHLTADRLFVRQGDAGSREFRATWRILAGVAMPIR